MHHTDGQDEVTLGVFRIVLLIFGSVVSSFVKECLIFIAIATCY